MKILYLSDRYTWNVYGVKRSLFEEMQARGHDMVWHDISHEAYPDGKFDQVWAAHSGLRPLHVRAPFILGFGFSDPNNFTTDRFAHYDAYVTNNHGVYEKHRDGLPMHYMPSWCDLKFHEQHEVAKRIGVSFIGCANHPWMRPPSKRKDWVKALQARGLDVQCWGPGWLNGSCEGNAFLDIINRSCIGLDISETDSPLAHRLFEYSACGTPVIARRRHEVELHFHEGDQILLYDDAEELFIQLRSALERPDHLAEIGANARKRCLEEHTIKHRVDALLSFLEGMRC